MTLSTTVSPGAGFRSIVCRYCMLGISLLQYLHRESQGVWPGLSVDQFLEELRQIQQFVLLYPPLGDKGPNRVATVLSKQPLA